MKDLVEMFGFFCLPLVLLAGITMWVWFPVVCVWCGYMAARSH